MKQIFTLIGILLFLFSCERDVYYYFTENEKAMFNYEEGDSTYSGAYPPTFE
jgi:hypothetical protein